MFLINGFFFPYWPRQLIINLSLWLTYLLYLIIESLSFYKSDRLFLLLTNKFHHLVFDRTWFWDKTFFPVVMTDYSTLSHRFVIVRKIKLYFFSFVADCFIFDYRWNIVILIVDQGLIHYRFLSFSNPVCINVKRLNVIFTNSYPVSSMNGDTECEYRKQEKLGHLAFSQANFIAWYFFVFGSRDCTLFKVFFSTSSPWPMGWP